MLNISIGIFSIEDTCTSIKVTLRHVQCMAPYNFSTLLHIVKSYSYITAVCFGKPHTNFGVLISMHAGVMTVSNLGCIFF